MAATSGPRPSTSRSRALPNVEVVVYPEAEHGVRLTRPGPTGPTAPTTRPTLGAAPSSSCRPNGRAGTAAPGRGCDTRGPVGRAIRGHELGDRLVHALARRADHPCQLLLGDRQLELVAVARELEQPLGGASGDVEEDGVGQGLVDGSEPTGQQPDDVPQGGGLTLQGGAHRRVGNGDDGRELEGTSVGGTDPVEQPHLAEEVTGLHEGHEGFAAVIGAIGDCHPSALDHEELGRVLPLTEEDVVASELPLLAEPGNRLDCRAVEPREERGCQLGVRDRPPRLTLAAKKPGMKLSYQSFLSL